MKRPWNPIARRALLILAALGPHPVSLASPQGMGPQAVITDTVHQEPVQQRARVIGSLRARATATLAALEEGPLVELGPRQAERVKAAALIARTDTRRLDADRLEIEARIAEARAVVAAREAELENRRRDLLANEAAAKQNAVSQRDLRNAKTAVDTGSAELGAAKQMVSALDAALARIDVRLQDAAVRAPFDSVVIERHAEPGEWVNAGDPLLTLQSIGTIEAWLEIPERHAADLLLDAANTHVELVAWPGTRTVTNLRVLPQVDPRSRSFALLADLDDQGGRLAPGMSVSAWVPLGAMSTQLLVSKDALVRRDLSTYVQRVVTGDGGDQAQPVPVVVLFELTRHVAIAPGALSVGDRVVIEGNERLMPGALLLAKPTDRPDPIYPDRDVTGGASR